MNQKTILQVNQIIKDANHILLVTHNRPDGDGLASVCAMADYLKELNKKFTLSCTDEPPRQFDFLPHLELFSSTVPNLDKYDLLIPLDCGSINRTGLEKQITQHRAKIKIIEFDHHPAINHYADLELRNPGAASTTEVVYDFFVANQININKNRATCILTGISTDTGNFLYPSTSSKTIAIASEMLQKGARLPSILDNTWRNKSLTTMKIWGKAINNLRINPKYNFAFTALTIKDIEESGASEEELEGIAGFLSNLEGVKGILFLYEEGGGVIKGSLRSLQEGINVAALAQKLGGGGHIRAAGFKIQGKLVKTEKGWKIE
ncbi:bifunctional oligoribonuclease/PAP phosphatase NrnA [Candidatus Parcubacteria bacterium]|nr:MAG: bifunctional oligoribonuclease/PAP phosphatase NrnA [Candidatus Parcubacteria bacterium]